MKKNILILIIFTSIFLNCKEQNKNELIGKWTCTDVLDKMEIPALGLEYLENTIVNKWTIELQEDGTFKTEIIDTDSAKGTWEYNPTTKLIKVKLIGESDLKFEVLKFDSNKIDLKSELGKFIFEKTIN
ncbi:hypothetical protein [Winogradskyella sp. UBA3174]|uniref:hypothetical protein n=1 Tax=Winogradskyella sp. UBA3174 TaxID=1947785 RepID=UPI0025EB6D1C|nr:hypothetical protein [Winogradskyella sp. UBA3174]